MSERKPYCELCGAVEGEPHHDEQYKLIVTSLEEHHGKRHCQPCLEGCRELEDPAGYLLEKAARLQGEFWDTLSELEAELGFDVDQTRDLDGLTVEDLKNEDHEEESEEDGDAEPKVE